MTKHIKLASKQRIRCIPQPNTSLRGALVHSIALIWKYDLKEVELNYNGFMFFLTIDSDINLMIAEYENSLI